MKNRDKIYLNICLDDLSYNELMELFKAVREEINRRQNETPVFVKDTKQ